VRAHDDESHAVRAQQGDDFAPFGGEFHRRGPMSPRAASRRRRPVPLAIEIASSAPRRARRRPGSTSVPRDVPRAKCRTMWCRTRTTLARLRGANEPRGDAPAAVAPRRPVLQELERRRRSARTRPRSRPPDSGGRGRWSPPGPSVGSTSRFSGSCSRRNSSACVSAR
jgi:hypothetical protein